MLAATVARMRARVVGVWVKPDVVTILGALKDGFEVGGGVALRREGCWSENLAMCSLSAGVLKSDSGALPKSLKDYVFPHISCPLPPHLHRHLRLSNL